MSRDVIRVGTRRSALARAQAALVMDRLRQQGLACEEVLITSHGDEDRTRPLHAFTQTGAFTRALEEALERKRIDLAVHSLKDLPLQQPAGLPVVAVMHRHDARDVLLVRESAHDPHNARLPLKPGSRIGTSSPRRLSQALAVTHELVPTDVRGNVDTRVKLLADDHVDALLMAAAAFERLDLELPRGVRKIHLPLEDFPACPGQGALAIQSRADHPHYLTLRHLEHRATRTAAEAERALLGALGGGCHLALGASVRRDHGAWHLDATYAPDPEGPLRRFRATGPAPRALVKDAARALLRPALTLPTPPRPEPVLAGQRILFVMEPARARPYVETIGLHGGEAAAWPTTEHPALPLDPVPERVTKAWSQAQWLIAASPRAVPAASRLYMLPRAIKDGAKVAAVGAATARALREAGLPVHLVSPDATGAGLARVLATARSRGLVVIPGALEPTPDLREGLERAGYVVLDWPVYETRALDPLPAPPLALPADALVIASASAARALPRQALARRCVAFGPTTAEAMKAVGIPVHAIAPRPSPEGILEVLVS